MPPTRELSSGHIRRSGSSGHFPRIAGTLSGGSGGSGGHPKFSDLVKQVKRSGKQLNGSTRRQVFFTLSATLLILAGFIAVGVTYAMTFVSTSDALLQAGSEFRRMVARAVSDEISLVLKPVHDASTRLSLRNSMVPGTAQGIWPLTPETIEDDFEELLANIWVQLTSDLHMTRVNANGTGKEFVPFLGIAVNIAVEEDLRTPSTDLHGCSAVLQAGVFLGEGPSSTAGIIYVTDNPLKRAYRSVFYTYGDGRTETKIRWTPYLTDIVSTVDFTRVEIAAPTCSNTPQMQVVAGGTPAAAADFNWFGPDGIFRGLEAMATIRNSEGLPIGYIMSGFSVIWSINNILNKIIIDGGTSTRGAVLAIISETGVLLGASGPSAEDAYAVQYNYVAEIPEESTFGQVFSLLRRAAGNPCPAWHESRDEEGRLTDAIPIYAEDYGLPPLTERWCVIQSYPRENLYAEIDDAKETRIISGLALAGLFFCATMLFLASLLAAVKSDRALRYERLKMDAHRAISAVKDVDMLNCPMALVSATDFLQLPELQAHEDMRDRAALTILDSLEEIETFKASNEIMFFSHQWLAKKFPDKGGAQLDAMKGAIRAVQANMTGDDEGVEKGVHIWCDYPSIAQRHTKMQKAAVSSLPLYARVADKFIIIAPPVIHADTLLLCDLKSYTGRGWCRAEMLAKACGSGIQDMYTCLDTSGTLSPVTPRDLSSLSLNIFNAEFTVRADMEDLVDPVLGLYSLVIRGRALPHMQRIYAHITEDKSNFFPETYNNGREEVKLFGKYIELLEMYITHGHTAMISRPSQGSMCCD